MSHKNNRKQTRERDEDASSRNDDDDDDDVREMNGAAAAQLPPPPPTTTSAQWTPRGGGGGGGGAANSQSSLAAAAASAESHSSPVSNLPPPPPPLLPRLVGGPPPPPLVHAHRAPPPRLVPALDPFRPPRIPFFIREIYKNGFLRRLPHHERRSGPLSKLMRTDRFWTVFSVHDDAHPFLELWAEPAEVSAGRPPHLVYPLAICQHLSPSLVAADGEWSFVVNFESGVAIRFACNSRAAMDEWVDCIRHKLGDMGILPARGNLYTKVPAPPAPKVARNPMSPLPSPPVRGADADTNANANGATNSVAGAAHQPSSSSSSSSFPSRNRLSIVDASDATNQSFTTRCAIYNIFTFHHVLL